MPASGGTNEGAGRGHAEKVRAGSAGSRGRARARHARVLGSEGRAARQDHRAGDRLDRRGRSEEARRADVRKAAREHRDRGVPGRGDPLMLFAVVVFPGSNCDHDVYHVAKHVLGCAARYVWHKDRDLRGADIVVLPGGFSYGDYLRTGAIARFSPIMEEIRKFAHRGGHLIGICNGVQTLLEAGLLPGAMRRNDSLKYVCRDVHLKVENAMTPWTRKYAKGDVVRIPNGHGDGNYFIDDDGLRRLEGEQQIAFRYVDQAGIRGISGSNPNGSLADIAGITNARGNVLGMMPHPERLAESVLGGEDGRRLFESIVDAMG